MATQKTVVVLGGPTGPTGNFEGVNILSAFTGRTGQYPAWLQATGASGPVGTLEKVYNIGPTGVSGAHKSVIILGFVPVSGGTGPAWDPANKTSTINLSESDQVATTNIQAASNCIVRSLTSKSSGKHYAELLITAPTVNANCFFGIHKGTITAAANASSIDCINAIESGNATFSNNANTIGLLGGGNLNGATLRIAVDFTAKLAWFSRNNGNWNADVNANPSTGVGGQDLSAWQGANNWLFARMITGVAVSSTHTARLVRLPSSFTIPTGFNIWV